MILRIFSQNEKELETLIQTIKIYSKDIGKEIGIFLKMNKRGNEIDGPQNEQVDDNTRSPTFKERHRRILLCQEKKTTSKAFRIAETQQFSDSKSHIYNIPEKKIPTSSTGWP